MQNHIAIPVSPGMVQCYFLPAASERKSSGEILEFTISYGQMEKIHATNVSFLQVKPRDFLPRSSTCESMIFPFPKVGYGLVSWRVTPLDK